MIDVSAVERLGYTVEVRDESSPRPYVIHGKRGAKYALMRNVPRPELLFAVNARRFTAGALVGGYTWFTDKDGALVPVR